MVPAAARRIVDLSHEIVDGMTTHPGIPPPSISTFLTHAASTARYAPGTTFEIGRIDLVANTGTYLDTPAHRFPGGHDLSGPGPRARRRPRWGPRRLPGRDRARHRARRLPWRRRSSGAPSSWPPAGTQRWGTPEYLSDNPFLTEAAAQWLVDEGAALVGIDSLNVDSLADPQPAGPHRDPRRRHPARRAPHGPRRAAVERLALLRGPAAHPGDGDVPGSRVRHRRLRFLGAIAFFLAVLGAIGRPVRRSRP